MEKEKKSVTMKDVAQAAGVSVGTVSRVINKENGIKPATLQKVNDAIEKLHYIPDHYARGMKRNRTETIALIIPVIWHPFFSEFAMYVERGVYQRGNKLLLCSIDGAEKEREYINLLQQNKVDGIIAITYSPIEQYLASGIPFVSVDRMFTDLAIACVSSDNEGGARLAAQQLLAKGCQHVAFIGGHNDTVNETKKRRLAFEAYVREQQVTYNIFDFVEGQPYLYERLEDFLVQHPTIDGIFAINDFMALDIIQVLKRLGKNVPEDVQVIGYDGIKLSRDRDFIVSTIQQSVEAMAHESVRLLFDIIEGRPYELQTIIPIRYIDGRTTKK